MIKTQITCCLPSSFLLLLEESGWVVLSRRMVKVKIAQSCLDSLRAHGQSMEFPRPRYWSGSPFPSPGDLPNLGVEPGSPALQADSLPSEPPEVVVGGGVIPASLHLPLASFQSPLHLNDSHSWLTQQNPWEAVRLFKTNLFMYFHFLNIFQGLFKHTQK